MGRSLKRMLIGRPLKNEAAGDEKYNVVFGLPILSSDAISSVGYAGQEMLIVLVPVIGGLAFGVMTLLSAAIIGLLALLVLSYSQTIESYPNGGGAYIVAKDNLGIMAGVTAGAALSVDYVMTVAVSISSGIEQLTSTFMFLRPYTVPICLVLVLLLMIGNLRGIRESSKMFSIPAYAFVFALVAMIICGIVKYMNGFVPANPALPAPQNLSNLALLVLALSAFSSGCTALTGVEAVSNSVPNFKKPSVKYAKRVLWLLALIVLVLFGGTSILANIYHVVPPGILGQNKAVLIQIASEVFGGGFMFYFVSITIFIILVLAANTAYSGFPMLVSVMAKEGYAPRQLSMRGDRLSYSNGIIGLSLAAAFLILIFQGNVSALIGLYAVGVFISFTLSQLGMLTKWFRIKGKHWIYKAFVNGLGATVTAIAVIIIAIAKFEKGAWLVVILIPILIFLMLKVKKHYVAVSKQLRITPEELALLDMKHNMYRNRVIVPIESINKASIRALRYARTISDHVVAFNVSIDEESGQKVKDRFNQMSTDISLIVKYSPFRKVVDPLLKFIESAEYDYKKGDIITVILPQFAVKTWWNKILHNRTRVYIEKQLMKHKHVVVCTMPLQLKDDEFVLKSPKYN